MGDFQQLDLVVPAITQAPIEYRRLAVAEILVMGCCRRQRRCQWCQIAMGSECRSMASFPKESYCVLATKVLLAIRVSLAMGVPKVSKRDRLDPLAVPIARLAERMATLLVTFQISVTVNSKDRMAIRVDATDIAPHHNRVHSIPIPPDRERPILSLPTMTDTIPFIANESVELSFDGFTG